MIYVDADAAPGGNGTSWVSAFQDLQNALAVAEAGDEVWVAEGVYKPTAGSDRTATFVLASGVALYGGFDGTEQNRDERDWTVNRSVLSGDIGVAGDSLDNAYHVVTANGVDATAILDGFTVRHGTARAATAPHDRGGGLLALSGSPTVRHCVFRLNTAWGIPGQGGEGRGGGVYVEDGSPLVEDTVFEENRGVNGRGAGLHAVAASPVLRRVVFRRNDWCGVRFADGSAGVVEDALFEENTGPAAGIDEGSPVFRRTTFRDNITTLSGYDGAGVRIEGGAPRFEDCLFENLRTRDDFSHNGGGVYVTWEDDVPARPVFIRTTFRDNTANTGGGAYVADSHALFLYCHFERNRALGGGGLHLRRSATAVVATTFVGNRAEPGTSAGFGGGLDVSSSPAEGRTLIASALFAGNAARHGGGASLAGMGGTHSVDLVNVTAAGNEASETGGGLRLFNAAGLTLHNAVVWGNEASLDAEVHVPSGSGLAVEQALVAGGCPAGATCTAVLDEDPLFVRAPSPGPDGTWGTDDDDYGDLRLDPSSPGIDYGLASLLPADLWDLDQDGDTTEVLPIDAVGGRRVWGPEVDLGAYERGPAARSPRRAPPASAASEAAEPGVAVHPNPMRGVGAVALTVPEAAEVSAGLYDVLGRRVAVLADAAYEAGRHVATLDGRGLASGVYVVRVVMETALGAGAPARVFTRRITLIR